MAGGLRQQVWGRHSPRGRCSGANSSSIFHGLLLLPYLKIPSETCFGCVLWPLPSLSHCRDPFPSSAPPAQARIGNLILHLYLLNGFAHRQRSTLAPKSRRISAGGIYCCPFHPAQKNIGEAGCCRVGVRTQPAKHTPMGARQRVFEHFNHASCRLNVLGQSKHTVIHHDDDGSW